MPPLTSATLGSLGPEVAVPAYDRSAVVAGVVHFGVGGFHRAHQAMYQDRLLAAGGSPEWGICGVGVMPGDRRMQEVLDAQDGLYTLVVKHGDGRLEPRVVGSIVEYLFAPDDPERVIERIADPAVRIVSLTVTEGGYNVSDTSGEFVATAPAVAADLEPGAAPQTTFGLVVEALARRRERGTGPLTVMSCDNLPGNGHLCRKAFVAFAALRDPDLGAWVDAHVAFPNSMVDRITPQTTDADRAMVAERLGVEDAWPVVCEPFAQWALEDAFAAGRPRWEDAGVQVVADVVPYELMKLRLLNAGHQALSYFAALAGHALVHDAARDPALRNLLEDYWEREARPTLPEVAGIDLGDYERTLLERFANPEVRDTIARLAEQTSDRIPKFVVPVIRERLAAGGEVARGAAIVASWARYCEGVDDAGRPIEVVDRRAEALRARAARQGEAPLAFLEDRELFGDLVDEPRFAEPYRAALQSLRERGARATLERLAAGALA